MAARNAATAGQYRRRLEVVRWRALIPGVILVAVAFASGSHVADTRQGLVFEVITLLGGLAGAGLLLYGLAARTRVPAPDGETIPAAKQRTPPSVRSANDVLIGAGGLVVAAALIGGIAVSSDLLFAFAGLVLLLPMVAGCSYLLIRFARAPKREWRLDLHKLTRSIRS